MIINGAEPLSTYWMAIKPAVLSGTEANWPASGLTALIPSVRVAALRWSVGNAICCILTPNCAPVLFGRRVAGTGQKQFSNVEKQVTVPGNILCCTDTAISHLKVGEAFLIKIETSMV